MNLHFHAVDIMVPLLHRLNQNIDKICIIIFDLICSLSVFSAVKQNPEKWIEVEHCILIDGYLRISYKIVKLCELCVIALFTLSKFFLL